MFLQDEVRQDAGPDSEGQQDEQRSAARDEHTAIWQDQFTEDSEDGRCGERGDEPIGRVARGLLPGRPAKCE